MEKMEYLNNFKHIHFVGIGGVSMSALAKICLNEGCKVTGSDTSCTDIVRELKMLGVKIFAKHEKQNVKDVNLVVYTCAVGENNCELVKAREDGIKTIERADFLQNICLQFKNVIAVSGSHGKTTTTAMIGCIFEKANLNPTIHIGGQCDNFNGNLKIGSNDFLITEACEYKKHILKIPHTVGVVLNVEMDHAECYKDYKDLASTFKQFQQMSKKTCIINEKYKGLFDDGLPLITFDGMDNGNFSASNIKISQSGYVSFSCYKNKKFFGNFRLKGFGYFNVYNALSAIAVADYYNISKKDIKGGLEQFKGVKRRFEYMGKLNNQVVIHDYAHHPTQINNVIMSARKLFNKPVTVVFQPHTYSRTKYLFSAFIESLCLADNVIIMPTYPAREQPCCGYDAKYLYSNLKKIKKNIRYTNSSSKVINELKKTSDNVILILGAGDICNIATQIKSKFVEKIREKTNKLLD